jgi:hypothetical protein
MLEPVNQGPRWDCLMKKTRGRKSRDTVPLRKPFFCDFALKIIEMKTFWRFFRHRENAFWFRSYLFFFKLKLARMTPGNKQWSNKHLYAASKWHHCFQCLSSKLPRYEKSQHTEIIFLNIWYWKSHIFLCFLLNSGGHKKSHNSFIKLPFLYFCETILIFFFIFDGVIKFKPFFTPIVRQLFSCCDSEEVIDSL